MSLFFAGGFAASLGMSGGLIYAATERPHAVLIGCAVFGFSMALALAVMALARYLDS